MPNRQAAPPFGLGRATLTSRSAVFLQVTPTTPPYICVFGCTGRPPYTHRSAENNSTKSGCSVPRHRHPSIQREKGGTLLSEYPGPGVNVPPPPPPACRSAPPQANIDFQCRQLKLGLRPTDLVRELTVSFFCPLQLSRESAFLFSLEPLELADGWAVSCMC